MLQTEQVLAGVIAAPRAVGQEGVHVRQVVEFQARRVEGVAVAALAEHGARLPRSACDNLSKFKIFSYFFFV